MDDWTELEEELHAWQCADLVATLWWRDDDARSVSPELERLLTIACESATPVALAVIPRDCDDALKDRLADVHLAWPLQHGWAHENHAPDADRQNEYGCHRPLEEMIEELAAGARRTSSFARGLPVLVAPWNRIDEALIPELPRAGVSGLSVLGPRAARMPAPGVVCCNVHVDIIDWNRGGGFIGARGALEQMLRHLRARRTGAADPGEPTGIMSHHLYHDEGCWWFLAELLARTRHHPAVRWLDAGQAFAA
jgi:hypothetical protein